MAVADATRMPTACPKCGKRHDGSDGPGRKSWSYHEFARSQVGVDLVPSDLLGELPSRLEWSYYRCKEAQRSKRESGSWLDLHRRISRLAGQVLPGGDKRDAPYLSSVAHKNRRSTDENCEAIHVLWFDSDGAGSWDKLLEVCRASGLAAIFQQSTSRKPDHWHVGIPLTQPITFAQGEWTKRAHYKLTYRHMVAVFSALAGFEGVGGHCGLDLCTDRLIQPMFPAMRRSEEDSYPGLVMVEGQALNLERALEATGFDVAVAMGFDRRQVAAARRRSSFVPTGDYQGLLGPLGLALKESGWLGRQKDASGVHAVCPFFTQHSGGQGQWDAIYFPGSDTWWCPHSSCRSMRGADARKAVLGTLPQLGRDAYQRKLDQAAGLPFGEEQQAPTGAIARWAIAQFGAPREKLLNALVGALLRNGFSDSFVTRALKPIDPDAQERVARSTLRRSRGATVAGAGWLRRTLGPFAAYHLAAAVAVDSGKDPVDLTKAFLSMELIRGPEAAYLKRVHDGLHEEDKIKQQLLRPTGCRVYGDQIKQWGREVGVQQKVCETLACGCCFFVRVMTEYQLLHTGWEQDGQKIEGWAKRTAPFWLHRVTGFRDVDHLQEALDELTRYCKAPRVRVIDWSDGPALLVVTDEAMPMVGVRSVLKAWAKRIQAGQGLTYTERKVTGVEAAQAVIMAKIAVHTYQRQVVANRDQDQLIAWTRWSKGKHLVSRSKKAAPFPTREVAKKASMDDDGWDIDWEAGGITYTALHLDTRFRLGTSEFPHTLYQIIRMAQRRTRLQKLLKQPDWEELNMLEALLAEREASAAAVP